MNLIIDTKEQKPLLFTEYELNICRDSLPAGDYTLVGHDRPTDDESVIFERKANCLELVTNLGKEFERFEREAQILTQYKHKAILVCGPANFDFIYNRGMTKLHPNFAYKQLAYLYLEYSIPTIFLDNRENVENFMFRTFHQIHKKIRNEE